MTLGIYKIDEFKHINTGFTKIEEVDTVPTPDTIEVDALALMTDAEYSDFESFNLRKAAFFEALYHVTKSIGVNNYAWLDAVPSPNTILGDFEAYTYDVEPFYPASATNQPGSIVGPGDVIAYIS
jgi:hypothetical protein